ncbi:MAG: phosphoribosylamine--glycine ligase [Candidatus Cloacimonetes bacterium]|nr:phosphoribosylamine--glycine ligase [Candidatus Cloacimonadota bacterium]
MNVLVIGSGGREHAIANAFASSADRVIVSPGNDGIAMFHQTVTLDSHEEVVQYCLQEGIDLVFIGPEQPIAEGLSDLLRLSGIACIGASQAAGRIETSKGFAKELMQKYHIPTARFVIADSLEQSIEELQNFSYPCVVKADGLAAGKGVHIVESHAQALEELSAMFIDKSLGHAGNKVIIEEYLKGWEVSLFVITDGDNYRCTVFSQDHKQLLDGDLGPNTGGMGAYAPVQSAEAYRSEIEDTIVKPVLQAMRSEGCPFEGILYLGLMITDLGAKVIEFNCRLGDPEAQVILPLLKTGLPSICQAILNHQVDKLTLDWREGYCVCVVLAAKGYPAQYEKEKPIWLREGLISEVIYAGVKEIDGSLVSNGGRVLNVVSGQDSIAKARQIIYNDIGVAVGFEGMTYRKDIGLRTNKILKDKQI